MAKNCIQFKSKPFLRTIDSPEAKEETDDKLWLRTIVAKPDSQVLVLQVAMKGPTYKLRQELYWTVEHKFL